MARGFGPFSAFVTYEILSVLWEFVDLNPDGEYRAVPLRTVETVLKFDENNVQK